MYHTDDRHRWSCCQVWDGKVMGFFEEIGDFLVNVGSPILNWSLGIWVAIGIGILVIVAGVLLFLQ